MAQTGNWIATFEKSLEKRVNTFKFPELTTPQRKAHHTVPFLGSLPRIFAVATYISIAVRLRFP